MEFKGLIKSKTAWTGAAAILGAAAGYFTGEMQLQTAAQMAFTGLLAIFLRQGVGMNK